jgi:hypothetical protein
MTEEVQRKTSSPVVVQSSRLPGESIPDFVKGNVLDRYRSYTYNITLAALSQEKLENVDSWKVNTDQLDLIVLSSAGKDISELRASAAVDVTRQTNNENELGQMTTTVISAKEAGDIVRDFNLNSPGRFDMYINNVELKTISTYAQGATLGQTISFDVFEPYSVNGFIEALHVASVGAGYLSPIGTPFLFKIEFKGYPDGSDITEPETILYSDRYYVVRFNDIQQEFTERGTKYSCKGFPFHESAFGNPNKLKIPVSVQGNTVGEVLGNLTNNLNEQVKKNNNTSKDKEAAAESDSYEIIFAYVDKNGDIDLTVKDNYFSKSKLKTPGKDYVLPRGIDAGDPNRVDANGRVKEGENQSSVSVFNENTNITSVIEAVIRDSEYGRRLLEKMHQGEIPQNGMVDWFIIHPRTKLKPKIDPVTNKNYTEYTYIITPYAVHYTKVPGFSAQKWKAEDLEDRVLREYNYVYTGNNSDLISMKLDYKHLVFENISVFKGQSNFDENKNSLAQDVKNRVKERGTDVENAKKDRAGTSQRLVEPSLQTHVGNTPNAGPPGLSAFDVMAKQLHESIINSVVNGINGEIEIIGDPLYLGTSGHGNSFNETYKKDDRFTKEGEMNYLTEQVFLKINFRNPVDIGPNGAYIFDNKKAQFGGIFWIREVTHTFNDGLFKQRIQITRLPGQILPDSTLEETRPEDSFLIEPDPKTIPVRDITKAVARPRDPCIGINIFGQIQVAIAELGRLNQLGAQVVNSITAPLAQGINTIAGQIQQGVNQLTSPIAKTAQEINAAITNATSAVGMGISELANKLCISPEQLQSGSPLALLQLGALAKVFPEGVDPKAAAEKGLAVNNIPVANLVNIPPYAPAQRAPDAEVNTVDLADIIKLGGNASLANAFGVVTPSSLTGVDRSNTINLLQQSNKFVNPLTSQNSNKSAVDSSITSDIALTILTNDSSSKETKLINSGASNSTTLGKSLSVNFGSKAQSPLTKLINS